MAEPFRILTTPVRVAGRPPLAQLATLVAADALVRRARATGRTTEWQAAVMTGDLAGQHTVERELAREGHDRASFGRDAFIERVRAVEDGCRGVVVDHLDRLGVAVSLDSGGSDDPLVATAARTAFVRLFEEGLLEGVERVVSTCPRCDTVVERADAEPVELEGERVTLRLPGVDGAGLVDVALHAVEMMPGVVAVAIPPGVEGDDGDEDEVAPLAVVLPIDGRTVPVVRDEGVERATLIAPAHDAFDFELSRRLGLGEILILDGEGIVIAEGPLFGLTRFAARSVARALLDAAGAIVAVDDQPEHAERCRRCRTVLVSRLGHHWFLAMDDLEVAATDELRAGSLTFEPPALAEVVLDRAGRGGPWCLSHQVWAGLPVPAATCLDCGGVTVSVEATSRCSKCMGALVPDESVLDARFVSAVWPLAAAGWPGDQGGPSSLASETTLLVAPLHLATWVLPAAALGLRLAGSVPFAQVAVQEAGGLADEAGVDEAELDALVE
ncbi:MAG TPA: class I tRNA ligase family protein, partial [Acidimicrobiales bacterium]|nr:class I tRNA ligase family protein [Acidimicrobiales bacterium]